MVRKRAERTLWDRGGFTTAGENIRGTEWFCHIVNFPSILKYSKNEFKTILLLFVSTLKVAIPDGTERKTSSQPLYSWSGKKQNIPCVGQGLQVY